MNRGFLTPLVLAVAVIVGVVLLYKFAYPASSYRYRMTVEVDTPEGVRAGSSVIEVTWHRQPQLLAAPPYQVTARGDAVFVDLGSGKHVIGLLAGGENGSFVDHPQYALNFATNIVFAPGNAPKILSITTGRWSLEARHYPTFVTFADLNDPKTARVVAPHDFAAVFGAGFALRAVTIEMIPAGTWPFNLIGLSGTPVTRGIEKRLPWWNGPFPWLKPIGSGTYLDQRQMDYDWPGFKWTKEHFRRIF